MGWYVTVNDITNWTATEKRRAEETLPLLVKKLILASCRPKTIKFPSGDSISVGGWDGLLEVEEGNEYIPEGISGWEFGTNSDVKDKADDDYSKRLTNPNPLNAADTTFVFVTSRLWTKCDAWIRAKQSTNEWKDVKGINAQTLQNWLEQCPSVHRWFAEVIGKRCADIWDVDQSWQSFASLTANNLKPEFFLYGRENEQKLLKNLLAGSPSVCKVKSRSSIEASAFVLSVIQSDDVLRSRCLIIRNQTSWDLMAGSDQSLILIPNGFKPNQVGFALSKGHKVLLVVNEADSKDASVFLTRQSRTIRQEAIKKLGFDDKKASQIYQDTKGYIEPLLRHNLMEPIDYVTPSWQRQASPEVLFAMFFATEWNEDNENDKNILSKLSGMPYHEFERAIINLSNAEDQPIRKVGSVWQIISKMDLWFLIAPLVAKPYIERFGNVISEVIPEVDPSYDLPSEERYMAGVIGVLPRYSKFIRHGLADSMTILSVYGDEYAEQLGGVKPSDTISGWIKKIFDNNNNTPFWYSISGITKLLAEAAPNVFLEAVENGSSGEESPLLGLFKTEGNGTFSGCYHSGLLWALELLSWNKQYFARTSLCLARLSEIDPGGNWANRPFNSLIDIYLGWINNTSATHAERIQVLTKVLIPSQPKVAWRLMISILMNNRHVTSGICQPEYREWSGNIEKRPSGEDYSSYVSQIVELLLQEFEIGSEIKILDLIDKFNSFNEQQQNRIIERMFLIDPKEIKKEIRDQILEKLRATLAHHREFPDAQWSWPSTLLERLEQVYNHLIYDDIIKVKSFLFSEYWPKLIDPISRKEVNYEERESLILDRRIAAIEAIYSERGIDGINELLGVSGFPYILGSCAFNSSFSKDVFPFALDWLNREGKTREFSNGYISSLANKDLQHAIRVLEKNENWPPITKARYLLCMPLNRETLKIIDELPVLGSKEFWTNLNYYHVPNKETQIVSYVASKLLKNDRPLAAMFTISRVLFGNNDLAQLDSGLVANILVKIVTNLSNTEKISIQTIRYEIIKAIQFLQDADGLPEQVMCQIEWLYLKILRFEEITPRFLMRSVAEDPNFFTQLVCWVYKRDDGQEDPKEDLEQELITQRAEIAWELLDTISVIPGEKGADIDTKVLSEWVNAAREALEKAGRLEIGDDRIGFYLSRCPVGKDGIWPHESVRTIIEKLRSKQLDVAMECGRLNSRGTTSRNLYDGGDQERRLAQKYREDAEKIQLVSPSRAILNYH
ncbi:XRE family transcriptional regulator [Desulfofarcimen acetoxidans DSM 771]|uniref:XRE family transcriptional regulator n=1 Tax=Desulfofarcimen acetoxidans (strain ATCC 49208 / DSM 771 / KCTC 5769 / VKM B-1644 / 5575) TaxID=485916 RepID=C8VVI0_DESAS|nr:hypothetical protein [Desulfofarcimen acetoxidans]ACV62295.1 XRE family transcriptional regulator [Desulfofarcimen acetoxidans DSM 771]